MVYLIKPLLFSSLECFRVLSLLHYHAFSQIETQKPTHLLTFLPSTLEPLLFLNQTTAQSSS